MSTLRIPPTANSPNKIQLSRISHVYLSHPDISQFERFAVDFGLVEAARDTDTIFYRGFGRDPYIYVAKKSQTGERAFLGGAFIANTERDYNNASELPGAVIHDLSKAPGGGRAIEVPTPGGSKIYIVLGQQEREVPARPTTATTLNLGRYNTSLEKFRKGEFQRFKAGPAMVHKLGHYGFISSAFDQDIHFYTSNFNFVPSDILYAPGNENMDVLTFLHLDLGTEYSNHHSLFFQRAPPGKTGTMHHCSFEVEDFDMQLIGHEFLLTKGYKPVWAVGCHVLGSQIFDYWKDTSGFTIEHCADGDLVNQDTKMLRQEAGPQTLSIWGPELLRDFAD